MRHYSLIDHGCMKIDKLLRLLSGHHARTPQTRENPAQFIKEADLSDSEKKHIAGLMRVNYAGEVCAQALYQGQALTARNPVIKAKLTQAGLEEQDHLYWCQTRLQELNSHVSYLNPLWFGGAFLLGLIAGAFGDRWNLGFLAETERQVVTHLTNHLNQLPPADNKTRRLLTQMCQEEKHHADIATENGGTPLPKPLQTLMQFTSKLMTTTAYWV